MKIRLNLGEGYDPDREDIRDLTIGFSGRVIQILGESSSNGADYCFSSGFHL